MMFGLRKRVQVIWLNQLSVYTKLMMDKLKNNHDYLGTRYKEAMMNTFLFSK